MNTREILITMKCISNHKLSFLSNIIGNKKGPICMTVFDGIRYDPQLPNIVITSHILLYPNIQGNRIYINQIIDYLINTKLFNVFLVLQVRKKNALPVIDHIARSVSKVFISDLEMHSKMKNRKGRQCALDLFYQGTEDILLYIHDKYKISSIIANYVHMASSLELLPNSVKKFVNTIDVIHRLKEFENYGIRLDDYRRGTKTEEAHLLSFADVIIAITTYEQKILKEMLPGKKVITLGFAAEYLPREVDEVPKTVFFFGSGNPLNVRGIEDFIKNSWSKIVEREPEAQLRIAGSVCEKIKKSICSDISIVMLGVLDTDALEKEKRQCQILLNSSDLGTGLKIKSIESIAAGKPFVSTPNGVEGIEFDENMPPFVIASSWDDFVTEIMDLFNNHERRKLLGDNAVNYTKTKLAIKNIYRQLDRILRNDPFIKEDDEIKSYVNLLMEAVPRLKLAGKLGVFITNNHIFSKYVIDYLRRNSLNLCKIYSHEKCFIDRSYQDINIDSVDVLNKNDIELCLIPTYEQAELLELDQLIFKKGVKTFNFIAEPTWEDREKIYQFKDKHKGEDAFILGNGPSVSYDDLNKLKGKLVFIANRFHKAYENTVLRGTYTASADILMVEEYGQEIALNTQTPYFVQSRGAKHVFLNNEYGVIEYGIIPRPKGEYPQVAFSEDLRKGVGNGASIIYDLIQLAVWMGVKRIYLYGIDHSFKAPANYTGKGGTTVKAQGESNHFIKDYRNGSGIWYYPVTEVIEKAFQVAKEYCDSHGIEIYNITRGGFLEIFTRKDFDDVV